MSFNKYEDDSLNLGEISGLEGIDGKYPDEEEVPPEPSSSGDVPQPVPDRPSAYQPQTEVSAPHLPGYVDREVPPEYVDPGENAASMAPISNGFGKYQQDRRSELPQEDPDEEYQPGMHDASAEGIPRRQNSTLKKFMVNVLPYVVVVIFLFWYFGDFINFGGGDDKSHVMSMQDEEYLKILAEKEDMARRLEINEAKMQQERKEMEDRFDKMFRSMQEADAERSKLQNEAMEKLRAEMQKLMEQRKEQTPVEKEKEPEVIVKTEPLKGSATKTGAYNAVAEMRERRAAEQAALSATKDSPLLESGYGLATATMIPARLDTRLVSLYQFADNNFWAVATTTEDVKIEPNFILPKGTRFLGKARADYAARRMVVDVERMQYGTTDIAVKGMILDKRKNVGMVTKYVDPKQRAMWSSLIPNLLSAMASSAKDLYDVEKRDDYGYKYTEKRSEASAKNVALDGLSQTFEDQARLIEEINREKPSIIIVESGTPVFVQLTRFVSADLLMEGGFLQGSDK